MESGTTASAVPQTQAVGPQSNTISAAIETYLLAKQSENMSDTVRRKLRYQLGLFREFMERRLKFDVRDISAEDVIQYRATWTWSSDLTRIKAQGNLRSFIRAVCRDNRNELLEALRTIKPTKDGIERRKPKPFSESEIKAILANIDDPKLHLIVRFAITTGLAVRDIVQLERKQIDGGWLRIERQKTGRPVRQKLPASLYQELTAVLNGNPRYVFFEGRSLADSETKRLQALMRVVMAKAGAYIKGNVFHRFRDTAVDFWLGAGWSMTDVAAALGDTVAVAERHYADLASRRMEERLASLPMREF